MVDPRLEKELLLIWLLICGDIISVGQRYRFQLMLNGGDARRADQQPGGNPAGGRRAFIARVDQRTGQAKTGECSNGVDAEPGVDSGIFEVGNCVTESRVVRLQRRMN